ncbi:hypothetical protein [Gimesia sp.]|uniref:hypothetical protein n=1 Tax=Gimesia sp. TaxID=2024833 RepID=UPI003A9221DE
MHAKRTRAILVAGPFLFNALQFEIEMAAREKHPTTSANPISMAAWKPTVFRAGNSESFRFPFPRINRLRHDQSQPARETASTFFRSSESNLA